MIILLTAACCGRIDLSCESFNSGSGIKGNSDISVSHSLVAFPSAAVSKDNSGNRGNDQNLKEENVISDILCRIVKKLLTLFDCGLFKDPLTFLKHFYISICIAGCTCLFLLTHIRFIHLKDGSK